MPVPKWITGTPGVSAAIERPHVRQHVRAVVGGREAADPAVEELHGLGAGGDLRVQIARSTARDEPLHQRVPRARVA